MAKRKLYALEIKCALFMGQKRRALAADKIQTCGKADHSIKKCK